MKWKYEESAAANAARELPKLAKAYFVAGRVASQARQSPRELHRFRIQTKRFRYALEMFAPVYGKDLAGRLEGLQQLQRLLGGISDAYTIRELLKHDGAHKKDLHEHGKRRIEEFQQYWKTSFDAPHEMEGWIASLGRERNQ